MRPALALTITCAAATAVAVAMTWPLALHLGDQAPVSTFTSGHLAALSVATHVPPWSTHTALAGWPGGVDFRPLLWPSIALAHLVGGLVAYNLTILLIPAGNVLGGWLLGRVLYGPGPAAVWLGALLAMPAWVRTTLQNGQPEQAVLGAAAAVLALSVWAGRGPRWRLLLVPPGVAFAGVSAPHVTLAALVLVGVWALAGLRDDRRRLVVAALAAVGGVAVAAYHGPGFDRSFPHFFAPFGLLDAHDGPAPKRAARLVDLFFQAHLPPGRGPWVVHLAYLGPVLGLAALVSARRARWAFAAGVLLVVLAFGEAGPYRLLTSASATLAASGTPYRFILGAVVAFAITVAPTRWAPLVAAVSLVEAARVDPRPLPFELKAIAVDPSSPWLARGEGPVLDVPIVGPTFREIAGHYLFEAGRSGRPTPLLLRSNAEAWGDAAAEGAAIEAALASPECAQRLPPLLEPYTAVVAHDHPGTLLVGSTVTCLTAILGTPLRQGEVRWWTRAATPAGETERGPP